jgi:hypothetical protein
MDEDDDININHSGYLPIDKIDISKLNETLSSLQLLGDDYYLKMQVNNLTIVDPFITELESQVLRKLIDDERTPMVEAIFLSAQSQMWIFTAYELLRTWRQRVQDIVKLEENGKLKLRLDELQKNEKCHHFGNHFRAKQIQNVIDDPSQINSIKKDQRRVEIPFIRLEAIRISLAKHEVPKQNKSVAFQPGYGRINSCCGSLEYEMENGDVSLGTINRRDIADELRALPSDDKLPSDKEIESVTNFYHKI